MSSKIIILEFGNRLKQIRKESRLTQKQFAERLDLAVSTYQYYERGEREAPVSLVMKITEFGFSPKWLLTGEGELHKKSADEFAVEASESGNTYAKTEASSKSNVIESQHIELVREFKNKPMALNINRALLELEKLDDIEFGRIESYIKGTVDTLKRITQRVDNYDGRERRQADRRTQNDLDKMPGGEDRRSEPNRRKA